MLISCAQSFEIRKCFLPEAAVSLPVGPKQTLCTDHKQQPKKKVFCNGKVMKMAEEVFQYKRENLQRILKVN